MFIIKFRTVFIGVSLVLTLAALVAYFVWGLKPGIDFTGGTLMEISRGTASEQELTARIVEVTQSDISVRPTEGGFIARTRELTPAEVSTITEKVAAVGQGTVVTRVSSVGPSLGDELYRKSLLALALVALGITLFIAIAFWRVSKPVSSWIYGLVTLVTLIHDVIIPVGAFSLLGAFAQVEIDALFVVALLTILGFSVHDTIVVFDRVRENLRINQETNKQEDFERTVGRSLTQTYARSINTSLTTIIVLLALFFLGGPATEDFALALLIGIAAGTYSSIFFASPLLVMIERWGKGKTKAVS